MCDIEMGQISGKLNHFRVEFFDCEGDEGVIHLELLVETEKSLVYSVKGNAASTFEVISTEVLVPKEADINPTKVFKKVAELLKKTLCPKCI